LYSWSGSLSEVISVSPEWWTPTAQVKAIVRLVLGLRFVHNLGLLHGHLIVTSVRFNEDGVIQITDFCMNHLMNPEGNSDGECRMPTSGVRAFAEVLSEITMSGSRAKTASRLDVPGFVAEIIERGLSGDSRVAISFVEIFEILKQNRFQIAAGVECDDVSKFMS
jgi:hypothetical protein